MRKAQHRAMCRGIFTTILALAVLLPLYGCGHWPPVVATGSDVKKLPASEGSIRARGMSDSDITSLGRLKQLRILDFAGGWAIARARITDEGLARLSRLDLPQLEHLDLGYCDGITDAGLVHVGRMHNIGWLSLSGCPRITDKGLPNLLSMGGLKALDLRGCPGITDRGLQHLATKADWEIILLGGCPNVTLNGVAQLQTALPNAHVEKDDEEWRHHQAPL